MKGVVRNFKLKSALVFGFAMFAALLCNINALKANTICGWTDKSALTSNDVSDTFPDTLIYNDLLYVFWNKSYDGSVSYMTYDGSSWIDRGLIADCKTASGIGAVKYDDNIFVFYSNGTYPEYHLFYRSFDGSAWSPEEQITAGDVYDSYGAKAVVYNGLLYLFWKRWQPDGIRHIYYMTFNGVSWSTPTHLVGDNYNNHPVTPVIFQNKLYLFYKHGVAYRVYDGSIWTDEMIASNVPALSGSEGSSAAAVVSNGQLILFLLSNNRHIYKTSFDGTIWGNEVRITEEPEDSYTILDMTASIYQLGIYLIWGGIYSWSSNELYLKIYKDTIDSDGDGTTDCNDGCPNDPNKIDPGICGCGTGDTDTDQDGVPACNDCVDTDPNINPEASEICDGVDNNCDGEIDEGCCYADVNNDCDLDVRDLVIINRYLQGFPNIVPSLWRDSDPNIPTDEEINLRIDECKSDYDMDTMDGLTIRDLVIIYRCIQDFHIIVPPLWRETDPNIPPDPNIARAAEALKPTCSP